MSDYFVQASAYLRVFATLRLSGTVYKDAPIDYENDYFFLARAKF